MDLQTQRLMMAAAGAGAEKTYVEDVFSTYLYPGNDSNIAVNNGIDISTEGGLVWIKNRDTAGYGHFLFDTERGTTKAIGANLNQTEFTEAKGVHTFSTNGFTVGGSGGDAAFNSDGVSYASWTFRKAPGFFDVVTWSGDGNAGRQISHSLGCVPGAIFAKRLNVSENWLCYHKGMGNEKYIHLNLDNAMGDAQYWSDTDPTSTYFTVNDAQQINGAGYTYVAYLFAGGESTAATARSVDFDGSNDDLSFAGSTDFSPGTGDFTFEAWIKPDSWSGSDALFSVGTGSDTGGLIIGNYNSQSGFVVRAYSVANYIVTANLPPLGQWTHIAVTRSGTNLSLFYNGVLEKSVTNSYDFGSSTTTYIAQDGWSGHFNGKVSNLRFVKGTAVYTSSFRPPTEPLTNITNTKLLCCNNSSTTGSTVTPGTITATGSPTASTDSPFDDSAGAIFGNNEDQNIIKCGSYTGESSHSSPVEINLGFEPQWVIIKNTGTTKDWVLLDTMRGWRGVSSANGYWVEPNTTDAEATGSMARVTSTGFICANSSFLNGGSYNFIYIAIRRPDGYVGKPVDAGTDVFAIDQWVSDSTPNNEANMISNFVVDWEFDKDPTESSGWTADWYARARLHQNEAVSTNSDAALSTATWGQFDYNNGWLNRQSLSGYTDWHSWMWKRHSGFDVGIYDGDGVNGRHIFHSMNTVPEFMIVKRLSATEDWTVYHTGLTSVNYLLSLNSSAAEVDLGSTPEKVWKSVPTSSTFEIGSHDRVNTANQTYLFLLFSSITGISKTGTYTGNGNSSGPTVTLGFAPRLIIVKEIDGSGAWIINDSYRGIGSGSGLLELNNAAAQAGGTLFSADSTSFTVVSAFAEVNESGKKYLYYCHA